MKLLVSEIKYSKLNRKRIEKLPKWLDMEDVCFLSGSTLTELRIVAEQVTQGEKHPDVFINANVMGKHPVFRTSLAMKHFDLTARGFLRKLDSCDWYELTNSVCAKEYNHILASIASTSCTNKIKNRKMLSEAQKLHIHNTASEKSLLPADEVEKCFAVYAGEVRKILDDMPSVLVAKLEGAGAEEIERVMREYGQRALVRLNAVSWDEE